MIGVRFPEIREEAERGSARVRSFVFRLRRLASALDEGPPLLAGMAEAIRTLLAEKEMDLVEKGTGGGGGWGWALRLDRLIRGEAREQVRGLVELVHELDALVSMAQATRDLGFSLPQVLGGSHEWTVEGLVHPFVKEPVGNDLVLEPRHRVLFLTGPNMAGKTTYLKACGVVALLAHCGMGVPARRVRIGFVCRLISAVQTEDSLWDGVSYFQAEARRVRGVLDAVCAQDRCLVIMDELFRGTNVKDAQEATAAVLRGFCRIPGSAFLVASHLSEVGEELGTMDAVMVRQVSAAMAQGSMVFDYRVREGVSSQRLGMEVLRREGVLELLESLESAAEGEKGDPPPPEAA